MADIEAERRSDDTLREMSKIAKDRRAPVLIAGDLNSFMRVVSLLLRMGADAETEKGTKSGATSQPTAAGQRQG